MRKFEYRKAPNPTEFSVKTGLGKLALDQKTLAKDIPCQAACPAKTRVPHYIEAIFKKDYDAAYKINLEDNVFPAALGRICTRPCQDACRHNWTGIEGPVQICHLKRSSADHKVVTPDPLPAWFKDSGKKVAVIGGGPAGLTAARELVRYGHSVTVFERENHLGGMMVDGIPKFRLPRAEVQKEIDLILNSGVKVELGVNVNQAKVNELKEVYDAILFAAGTMIPTKLDVEGVSPELYFEGLNFMNKYNNGEITELNGDVVVIGGGFTAVDCSRASARAARLLLGDEGNVTIVYRRTEQFMAANQEEIEEMHHENIEVRTLATPLAVITENGKLKSVKFQRNIVEDSKDGSKPRMIAVEGGDFEIPCTHLVVAIGQKQDLSLLPESVKLKDDQTSSDKKIFAAGDYLTGSSDVIHAVAEGKAVADRIDQFLTGEVRKKYHVSIEMVDSEDGESGRVRDHDVQLQAKMPVIDLLTRAKNDAEVETGFAGLTVQQTASRCYLCHNKYEIDQDKCIHCDWCIDVAPRNCIKRVSRIFFDTDGAPEQVVEASLANEATYIYIDSDECIRCGKCLRVCPTGAISMRKMERVSCFTTH